MKVLCIDPGPHVGAACWTSTGLPGEEGFSAWEWTPVEFYDDVRDWVRASDVVVAEDFRISGARASEANVTIEMIGVLRYLSRVEGKEFVTQEPGAYKFAGGPMLKRLGWYTPGSDHARSASGHLVLYLATAQLIDRARLLDSTSRGGGD